MRRVPVQSSMLASVGYDEETATLEVEFRSGAVYRYFVVPRRVVDALLAAESIGTFFNAEIRNTYGCVEVR